MGSEAVQLEVDGHSVRLSHPDKVWFPERGFTKLDVAQYFLAVQGGVTRALRRRPTTLQRFPDGVDGEFFYQKRAPKNKPDWLETARISFPSGRHADEICPDSPAAVLWAVNLGCLTFHPWPVRAPDTEHPDELRVDLDPQPWHGLPRRRRRRPDPARDPRRVRPARLAQDLRRARPARLHPDRAGRALRGGPQGRHRAGPRDRAPYARAGHHGLVEGGARRAHLRRLQPDRPRPHHRRCLLRPRQAPRPGLRPAALGRTGRRRPPRLRPPHHAGPLRRPRRRARRHRRPLPTASTPSWNWPPATAAEHGLEDLPYPPDHPKMPGEPRRVQPSRARRDPGDSGD